MIGLIWFTWLMNQFFLTIILLNFLIAILAESFNTVMEKAMIHKYKQRSGLNVETFLTMNAFFMLTNFEGILLSAATPEKDDDDPIDVAVETIQETQNDIKKEIAGVNFKVDGIQNDIGAIKEILVKLVQQ